ncbi:thiamin pyrophosphokinase 1 isoform X1 [Athalia rosae]|uniref:thiamin pyrophosphokinase 1 isoform X1 n=1 Tax=Athalia rosae TaxID=37344 RepID=UPI00203379E1|nr:thiamin pyrophosphokinase 1 isoform X1 [Athalia rosae]XP_048514646.1 thiamin pyrophosphokinase 1 isoform X1 [Athalia rosae]XP_048514647.1 thiamin pyrophosphokinase 1 isoform X1 [Athalia rosae]
MRSIRGSLLREILVGGPRNVSSRNYLANKRQVGCADAAPRKNKPVLDGANEEKLSRTLWDPLNLLICPPAYNHALVILNRPLHWKHNLLFHLWKKAQVTVTVDGGTDRWIDYLGSQGEPMVNGKNDEFLPTLITGDMDSISQDTIGKLRSIGANVIETPDQDATDYTKALVELASYIRTKGIKLHGIYVFTETSGRLDHIIANINTIFMADKLVGDTQVIQVASESLTWLLHPGTHRILIPEVLVRLHSWCALMPVGSRVTSITSTGLKWNLDRGTLEIGGTVSTSNTYSGSREVTVTTDTPVLWSMDVKPLLETFCPETPALISITDSNY